MFSLRFFRRLILFVATHSIKLSIQLKTSLFIRLSLILSIIITLGLAKGFAQGEVFLDPKSDCPPFTLQSWYSHQTMHQSMKMRIDMDANFYFDFYRNNYAKLFIRKKGERKTFNAVVVTARNVDQARFLIANIFRNVFLILAFLSDFLIKRINTALSLPCLRRVSLELSMHIQLFHTFSWLDMGCFFGKLFMSIKSSIQSLLSFQLPHRYSLLWDTTWNATMILWIYLTIREMHGLNLTNILYLYNISEEVLVWLFKKIIPRTLSKFKTQPKE